MMVRQRLWLTFAVAMAAIVALGTLTVVLALRARHAQQTSRVAKADVSERVALSMEFREYVMVATDLGAGHSDDGRLTLSRLKIAKRLSSISLVLDRIYRLDPERGRVQSAELQAFLTDFDRLDRRVQSLAASPPGEAGVRLDELLRHDIASLADRTAAMVAHELDEIYDDEGAMLRFIDTTIVITVLAAATACAGVFALAFVLLRRISGSLGRLHQAALRFAEGRTTERFSAPGTDEFGALAVAFNRALDQGESLRRAEKLATVGQLAADYAATLEHRVEERTRALDNANQGMRLVLDNVAQGFITVDLFGAMAEERSRIVETWFGPPAGRASFQDLVRGADHDFVKWFDLGLESVRDDVLPLALCLDQMPRALVVGERIYGVTYTSLGDDSGKVAKLLLIVTDRTSEVAGERAEREQRETLALFQAISRDRGGFDQFLAEVTELIQALETPGDVVVEKRILHTLKGNLSLYHVGSVAAICHQLETEINDSGAGLDAAQRALIGAAWAHASERIQKLLGETKRDAVGIGDANIDRLLERVVAGAGAHEITATLRSWRNEPVERAFARLADHAKTLSVQLDKPQVHVSIEDGGVRLDATKWSSFWANFVHVVRNAVDHGIEEPSLRSAGGKPEHGTIEMLATAGDRELVITLCDDGRGIDWQAVRAAAARAGLAHETSSQLVEALFADGVTTKSAATITSGRGVGLSALREAVRELGGRIEVVTDPGKGTRFMFRFSTTPSLTLLPVARAHPMPVAVV